MKQNILRLLFLTISCLGGALFFSLDIFAAGNTFYVCGSAVTCNSGASGWSSGSDSNNCTSKATPCATTNGITGKMSSGDTAIFGNGSYGTPSCSLVHGSPSNGYTTIKAEQMGGVTMGGIGCGFGSSAYLAFDGLFFTSDTLVEGTDHVKFLRCGNKSVGNPISANFAAGEGASYILFEQCYAYGNGRYKFLAWHANNIVMRQNVVRMDAEPAAGQQIAGLAMYSMSNGLMANNIVIDSDHNEAWSDQDERGCYYFPDTSASTLNIVMDSNLCLNSKMGGINIDGNEGNFYSAVTANNNVIWNASSPEGYLGTNYSRGNYDHWINNTFGVDHGSSNTYHSAYYTSYSTAYNNLFWDIQLTATKYWSNLTHDYNVWYQYSGGLPSLAAHERTNINPIWNASTNPTGALKYITRIEPGSNLTGIGQGGANIGATLQYMIGVPGTVYGETGYNVVQNTPMWSFPNEDVIKTKMAAYSNTSPPLSGARGFAAPGTGLYGGPITLTSYIWEYLGNPCPTGVCVSTPDIEPPTSPSGLGASAFSSSSITVSWTASTDNVGVTGYVVERCQGSGCSTFTQVGTPTTSPFVDSGLVASTFYNYHVRATDAAGNLSGWSNVVGATTQAPDTQPPTAPTNLQTSVVSSSGIDLTWTASTDNVGVTNYKVERCSGSGCLNFSQIETPTTNSYSDIGLSPSTLYRYRVRATDAANNTSNYSAITEATTPQAPPTPTFVAEYETAWNSATSPKTTSNFSVQSGDILVAYAVNEDAGNTLTTPPAGTLTGAWTLRQSATTASYTGLRLWSMNVASNQSNVNVSFANGGNNFGGNVLHFRNASGVGVTAQASNNTGNPTLTLNGVSENSGIVMVNGDWSAKTGARTYNTTQAGSFTETSAFADGTSYGVEAGYYANAGASGNKTIGLTAPTGMTWALAALEVKGNPTAQPISCNTVTTANFSQAAYNSYGAPFDAFQTSTNLIDAKCTSADTHTVNLTTGVTGDTTRIVYTKGYWYDAVTTAWRQYTGTCTGALNGEWCQGSVSATITDANVSTASSTNPTYLVGMTCSVQGGSWKCGCRDTNCTNFSWQIQGAGM